MIENVITEMCIHLKKETWVDVKGGKYTKDTCYKNAKIPSRDYRPVCKCGYPAEVFLSKTNEIWFKCSNANASWVEFVHPYFYVPEPCDFFQKYMNDHEFRMRHKSLKERESSVIVRCVRRLDQKVGRIGNWTQEYPCCVCKEYKYTPVFNFGFRALCTSCLDDRYNEIDKKTISTPKFKFVSDNDED